MSEFKPKTTVASSLPAVVNGSLIATTDTGDLYVDSGNRRIKLTDVITGTYSEIKALNAPLPGKLYFATDTHKLLQAVYSGNRVTWTELNSSSGGGSGGTEVYGSPQALITKANNGSPSVNDNDRGYLSVDFQAERSETDDYASGEYSFLYGRNCSNVAKDGYAFGSGTRFDVDGAIQTNQYKTGTNGWQGHTGIIGKSFEWNGDLNFEIFKVNTGTIALFEIDIIIVITNGLTLSKYNVALYRGQLSYSYNYSPVCQWSPWFYLSDNKIYIAVNKFDVMQLGIRYTILGTVEDEGDLS